MTRMDPNHALTPEEEEREREAKRAAIAKAMDSVRQGRVVPHDQVLHWLDALAEGSSAPRPL